MPDTPTPYQGKELRKRWVFTLKLILYIALVYLNETRPELYSDLPRITKAVQALILFLGANLLISLTRISIIFWYIRRKRIRKDIQTNFILGINRIASVLNAAFFVVALMIFLNVNPTEFFTGITIVAAAIAILSKDYITNMINGLIIMFSDQLSLGDHIIIGEHKGKILDITLVNLVLENDDNDMVLIPNTLIFTSNIVNLSKQHNKKVSLEFELDLARGYTPDLLEERVRKILEPYEKSITGNSLMLKTLEVRKDLARFKIQFLMPWPDKDAERRIRRTIFSEIMTLTEKK